MTSAGIRQLKDNLSRYIRRMRPGSASPLPPHRRVIAELVPPGHVPGAERRPALGEAYNNLAVVYMQTGRFKEADDALKSAERIGYRVHPQLKQDIKARLDDKAKLE